MLVSVLLAIAPIVFVCILMFGAKKSVNFSGIAGWILACVIAVVFFSTSIGDTLLIIVISVIVTLTVSILTPKLSSEFIAQIYEQKSISV